MRISTRYKVFLILLLAIGLVVAGMTVFMTQSLEEGFVRFIDARQQTRIDGISERLVQEYVETGSWQRLDENEVYWAQMLVGNYDMPKHRPVPPSPADLEALKSNNPLFAQVPGVGNTYLPVERRVMLLDIDKSIIYGNPQQVDQLKLNPLIVGGSVVGYLGVLPGPTLLHLSGAHFIDKQSDTFLLIALAVMVISALLAFPLVGHLMRPLRAFTQGARALAAGHYDARIPVESNDELGQMAKDFNGLAQALEDNEMLRRQWVADISHELRTPLSILRGEIEALQDGMRPLDQKAVNALHGEVLHLGRLVGDLYELSMSDLGSLTYRKTLVDPVAILQDCLDAHEVEFQGRDIALAVDNQINEPLKISADRDRLAQLFDNLLSNTLRYTDAGGYLRVIIGRTGNDLLLDFMDSTPGVPAEDLPHLFDRFFRGSAAREGARDGAGLGLSICRNIVHAHGGTIAARAAELGGVWVRVTLPL